MTLNTKALILGVAFVLSAAETQAAITVADVLPSYQDGSYSAVEVRESATRITVEATKAGLRSKTVYDKASGAILSIRDESMLSGGGGDAASGQSPDHSGGDDHGDDDRSDDDHGGDDHGGDDHGGDDHGDDDHGGDDRSDDDHGGDDRSDDDHGGDDHGGDRDRDGSDHD